jgi:hypothetical protein
VKGYSPLLASYSLEMHEPHLIALPARRIPPARRDHPGIAWCPTGLFPPFAEFLSTLWPPFGLNPQFLPTHRSGCSLLGASGHPPFARPQVSLSHPHLPSEDLHRAISRLPPSVGTQNASARGAHDDARNGSRWARDGTVSSYHRHAGIGSDCLTDAGTDARTTIAPGDGSWRG